MSRRAFVVGTLFAIFVATLALEAPAQNWTGWRGAGRDGKLEGFEAPATWPEKLVRGWQVEVGTGHSTPALVDGKLYVHARQEDDEVVLCLDAKTGKELWRDTYPAPYKMDPTATKHGKGPKSSVAVADGRVFTLGITGTLTCLDAKTGTIVWRHPFRDKFPKTSPQYGTAMSPLVVDGMCIAHVGGDKKGALVAFDAATGKERWSWDGDGPAYASPVLVTIGGKKQLITQTQYHAVGLSPDDGTLLWKMEFKTDYEQNSVTPVVFENRVILSGYHLGTLAYQVDGKEPKEAWKSREVSQYMSTPVLKGNLLFGFSEKRRGQYFCVDAKTGETLWTGDGRQGENAAVLDGGKVILALNTDSELVVFQANEEDFVELARYTVADTPTWAHPVVSGHTIFVKDETSLIQWTLP